MEKAMELRAARRDQRARTIALIATGAAALLAGWGCALQERAWTEVARRPGDRSLAAGTELVFDDDGVAGDGVRWRLRLTPPVEGVADDADLTVIVEDDRYFRIEPGRSLTFVIDGSAVALQQWGYRAGLIAESEGALHPGRTRIAETARYRLPNELLSRMVEADDVQVQLSGARRTLTSPLEPTHRLALERAHAWLTPMPPRTREASLGLHWESPEGTVRPEPGPEVLWPFDHPTTPSTDLPSDGKAPRSWLDR